MFTTLATTKATDRSSTRKSDVIWAQFIPAQSPTKEAATRSAALEDPKSTSEIWLERARPSTSPIVAIPIVNQNDVRTTSLRWSASGESKEKRKKALGVPIA